MNDRSKIIIIDAMLNAVKIYAIVVGSLLVLVIGFWARLELPTAKPVLEIGHRFTSNGHTYIYKGGSPTNPTNWMEE